MDAKCGCRGIRNCLVCQPDTPPNRNSAGNDTPPSIDLYQCYNCGKFIEEESTETPKGTPLRRCKVDCDWTAKLYPHNHVICPYSHEEEVVQFDGTIVVKEFISSEEELALIRQIDESGWAESQSGRRKQDYGPKVNFKKAKVKLGSFNGLPEYSKDLVTRLSMLPQLSDFTPVELCNLDYNPSRGSAIDPHLDDSWIWGERLVTLNLLSDTYLSFSHSKSLTTLHIPMPRRSVIIVMGVARHLWNHFIIRDNITCRRVAMTMRELGTDFTMGHKEAVAGEEMIRTALTFSGKPVNFG